MELFKRAKKQWERLDESWRFAITAFLIARIWFALWAWIVVTMYPVSMHYYTSNNQPAVAFIDLRTSEFFYYTRTLNNETLTFTSAGEGIVQDEQTNSLWDIKTGLALQGPFAQTKLNPGQDITPYSLSERHPYGWLAIWQRWDANWYTSIAEFGYTALRGAEHFPPLYPLLINLFTPVFGSVVVSGLVLSHVSSIVVIKLLFDLFHKWSMTSDKRSILYFLSFPTSFFLFSIYSESLFLIFVLLAFRSMNKKDWAWAGFWVFCAILTRLQGVALGIPLIYLIWQDRPILRKFSHWAGLGISGIGILFYLLFRSAVSDNSANLLAETYWKTRLAFPWENYGYALQTLLLNRSSYIDLLNFATTTLLTVLIIANWKKLPQEYMLYTVVTLIIVTGRILEGQPLSGMMRFTLSMFPVFYIVGNSSSNRWLMYIVLYLFFAINLFLSAKFFMWGWVA